MWDGRLIYEKAKGRFGEGSGNTLQYSCLENSLDRGARWVTVHGVTKELDMTEYGAQFYLVKCKLYV